MRLLNESYEIYKSNQKSWEAELEERKELERTLEDGLENE